MKDIAIVGGGILGLAIGYELSHFHHNYKVYLFEKESCLGKHQSGNNSGVLHCGLYYKPGSLKATLAVDGIRSMISFCQKYQIPHQVCGKVVVASDDRESGFLENLASRGNKNGLKGLQFLNNGELKKREPNVKAKKALLVPEEGIVDYHQVMEKLADLLTQANGEIHLNHWVESSTKTRDKRVVLKTNKQEKAFDLVINCSGLQSDRNYTQLSGHKSPLKIVPFRGEYRQIKKDYSDMVRHLIYPVPDPNFPFLGVHFTRMISGLREVGPNAVLAFKREGYKITDISLRDVLDTITYKGLRNFIFKNFSFATAELCSSLSKRAFVSKAQKLVPDIEEDMLEKRGTAGVRAQAISPEGDLIMDFHIAREENQIHVLNAPSPGATASLAIAKYIVKHYINA